jgi:hypothetical protein
MAYVKREPIADRLLELATSAVSRSPRATFWNDSLIRQPILLLGLHLA